MAQGRVSLYKRLIAVPLAESPKAWRLQVSAIVGGNESSPQLLSMWFPKTKCQVRGTEVWASDWILEKKEEEEAKKQDGQVVELQAHAGEEEYVTEVM
jgi:hypothetical protein